MNREIKFRGQDKVNQKWLYGNLEIPLLNQDKSKYYILGYSYGQYTKQEVDPKTVGQYTGLKDKNGKEIYEGDIVEREFFAFNQYRTFIGEIKEYECAWWIDNGTAAVSLWNEMHELNVIGNIYENLELLGEKHE